MEEQQKRSIDKRKKSKFKKRVAIIVACIIAILGTLTGVANSYDKIYENVSVCDVKLGGKTTSEAQTILEEQFGAASPLITVKAMEQSTVLEFGQIAEYDYETTAQEAYDKGRHFGYFNKVIAYYTPFVKHNLPLVFFLNEETVSEKLGDLNSKLDSPFLDTTYEIKGDKLLVKTGHSGNVIDSEDVVKKIKEALGYNTHVTINAKVAFKEFEKVDIDKIYKEVHQVAEDAKYEEGEEESKLISHKLGYDFDKSKAKEIIGKATENTTYEIPLIVTYPEITEAKLTGKLFSETLSTYTTKYNPGEVDRSYNMLLASNKVNNTVLAPGQVFSYNDVVGKRTVAAGYRNAKVFENGRVVDGLAGGICQVSSTLYNAVLHANLEIVERKNHSFPVSYTPKGQDATVVMGAIDFKFRNSTSHPIKVISSVSGGKCTISVLGIKENNFKVEIENTVVSTKPYETVYVNDSSLEPGVEKVLQKGSNGYTVNTVRIVYVDGKIVKRENLPSSYYIPLNSEVARNEGAVATTPSPTPTVQPTNTPVATSTPQQTPKPTVTTTPTSTPTLSPQVETTPTNQPTSSANSEGGYSIPQHVAE